jgi:hypothetical protein
MKPDKKKKNIKSMAHFLKPSTLKKEIESSAITAKKENNRTMIHSKECLFIPPTKLVTILTLKL